MTGSSSRAFARIDLAALQANHAEAVRRAAGRTPIAVVKADAYGHGAVPVARALVREGCRRFAVVTVGEACALRDAGIGEPLLVLGGAPGPPEAQEIVARRLCPVVHGEQDLAWLREAVRARGGGPLDVQVEVDTGMTRMGVSADLAAALLARVAACDELTLAGTFTHLARADEEELDACFEQIRRFRDVLREARRSGVAPGEVHVANSAGLLVGEPLRGPLPETHAVRPGLMLYGVRPAPHLEATLRPVMSFVARVHAVRAVPKGTPVGYGATWRAERDTRIATLPVGYADGVPVAASNRGTVALGGRRLPIVGRVSMDSTTVDVGDAPVEAGDEALLFGAQDGATLPVEEAALAAGTIAYELLVRVGARVPRRYEGV
ncbi:MAG: alanine racemase [Myxococcota bacterium]